MVLVVAEKIIRKKLPGPGEFFQAGSVFGVGKAEVHKLNRPFARFLGKRSIFFGLPFECPFHLARRVRHLKHERHGMPASAH